MRGHMTPSMRFVDARRFKEAALAGKYEGLGLHKAFACDEVRAVDAESRVIDFVISSGAVDREGDTIAANGWELENFRKNPVVLFAHDHGEPPIARALSVATKDGKLTARTEFMAPDLSAFSHMIFRMYAEGFMRAVSVGFQPLEWSFAKEEERKLGIDFHRQELLEFSAVPVPANPEALVQARAKGIDTLPLKHWAERVLDDWRDREGVLLTRNHVETLRREADPKRVRQCHLSRHDQDDLLRRNLAAQKTECEAGATVAANDTAAPAREQASDDPKGPHCSDGLPESVVVRASDETSGTSRGAPASKRGPDDGAESRPGSSAPDREPHAVVALEARLDKIESTVRNLAHRLSVEGNGADADDDDGAAQSHAVLTLTADAEAQGANGMIIGLDETAFAGLVRDVVSEKLRAVTGRID